MVLKYILITIGKYVILDLWDLRQIQIINYFVYKLKFNGLECGGNGIIG